MKGIKSCKKCKALTNGSTCPNCQSAQLVDNWKGRVVILNTEQSEIAKRLKK